MPGIFDVPPGQPLPPKDPSQPDAPRAPKRNIFEDPPGMPIEQRKALDAIDPNGRTVAERQSGFHIPKYSVSLLGPEGIAPGFDPGMQEIVRGAVSGLTLGRVDIGARQRKETTGETFLNALGSMASAPLFPLGPGTSLVSKLGVSKTVAGALVNIAATEVETEGQASKGRLILAGTFGALFGHVYGGEQARAIAEAKEAGKVIKEAMKAETPAATVIPKQGPLLLEDFSTPSTRAAGNRRTPDFYAGEQVKPGPTEFGYETTSLKGERVLPGGKITQQPTPPVVDVINKPYSVSAVEGPGLFQETLPKKILREKQPTAGQTFKLERTDAQKYLAKMKWNPDKKVREAAKDIETFNKYPEPVSDDTGEILRKLHDAREGTLKSDGIRFSVFDRDQHIPLAKLRTGIWGGSYLRPAEAVMGDVQVATGGRIPAYKLFWDTITARQVARNQTAEEGNKLLGIVKGMKKERGTGILNYVLAGDDNERAIAAHVHQLSAKEINQGLAVKEQLRTIWERNFPDTPFDKYLYDYLPRLKKADPADLQILRNEKSIPYVERWAANHEFNYGEKDLVHFASAHIRALSMHEHFDDAFKVISKIAANRDGKYPTEFAKYVGDWGRAVRGTASTFSNKFNPVFKRTLQRLGVDATDADVRDVLDNYITLTHAGLVGFRPAPLLHNIFNTVQTGSRIGVPWLFKGMKMAVKAMQQGTAERALVSKAGMLEEASTEMNTFRELAAPGAITRSIRKIADFGLAPYGTVDDYNRSAIFLGMRERFLDAARRSGGDINKLKDLAGLKRLHPAQAQHILEEYTSKGTEAAAQLAGVHAAQSTQWVYRTEFRPVAITGDLGRALGQFGVWPLNYAEYMKQMVKSEDRVGWMKDFALTNGSIFLAMAAMGQTVGLRNEAIKNTAKWTGLGPLNYAGGPLADAIMTIPQIYQYYQSKALGEKTQNVAVQKLRNDALAALPMIGLQRDIARAKGPIEQQAKQVWPPIGWSESKNVRRTQDISQEIFRFATGIGPQVK